MKLIVLYVNLCIRITPLHIAPQKNQCQVAELPLSNDGVVNASNCLQLEKSTRLSSVKPHKSTREPGRRIQSFQEMFVSHSSINCVDPAAFVCYEFDYCMCSLLCQPCNNACMLHKEGAMCPHCSHCFL